MEDRVVMASRFKERCLALLDLVARTKVPVVVTKHGKPVAKLVPIDEPEAASTMGSVRLLADDDEAYFSTGETWVAEGPHH
jgi:prevent-host-death family protein